MDAIRAAFESQFGTEWSTPVKKVSDKGEDKESSDAIDKASEAESEDSEENEESDPEVSVPSDTSAGPIVVKHGESAVAQPAMTKSQRRKFMSSGAPRDDTAVAEQPVTKQDNEDLANDLALQRLIEESHILSEQNSQFTGADISGAVDPMENVGKTRWKLMDARLAKAGAKKTSQHMPQAMAVGIRNKRTERKERTKQDAKDAGIILAKDRFTKSKNKFRDRGLKINTVGKASEHGIHVSQKEIDRINGGVKKRRRK